MTDPIQNAERLLREIAEHLDVCHLWLTDTKDVVAAADSLASLAPSQDTARLQWLDDNLPYAAELKIFSDEDGIEIVVEGGQHGPKVTYWLGDKDERFRFDDRLRSAIDAAMSREAA